MEKCNFSEEMDYFRTDELFVLSVGGQWIKAEGSQARTTVQGERQRYQV